jgi:hypothetical protein
MDVLSALQLIEEDFEVQSSQTNEKIFEVERSEEEIWNEELNQLERRVKRKNIWGEKVQSLRKVFSYENMMDRNNNDDGGDHHENVFRIVYTCFTELLDEAERQSALEENQLEQMEVLRRELRVQQLIAVRKQNKNKMISLTIMHHYYHYYHCC